jgi:hypothetical protein
MAQKLNLSHDTGRFRQSWQSIERGKTQELVPELARRTFLNVHHGKHEEVLTEKLFQTLFLCCRIRNSSYRDKNSDP